MVKIRRVYDEHDPSLYASHPEGESLTQQHFRDTCDINKLIARHAQTGFYYDPFKDMQLNARQAMYGDFSDVMDYRSSLDAVNRVQEAFMELSAEIRRRFEHDPGKFLEFIMDPANAEEARKMGLYVPEVKEESVDSSAPSSEVESGQKSEEKT